MPQKNFSESPFNPLKRRKAVQKQTEIDPSLVVNLNNEQIKKSGSSTQGGSTMSESPVHSTRSAVDVRQIDDQNATIARFRVKLISYGNQSACWEVLMQKLYELIPGTDSPHTLFGVGFDDNPEFFRAIVNKKDFQYNQDHNIPNYYVASPYVSDGAFYDLGNFLVDTARHIIPAKFLTQDKQGNVLMQKFKSGDVHRDSIYGKLKSAVLEIEGNTPEDKLRKRDLLFKIYDLLPESIRSKFDIAYYNSQWIGNWDFLNFSLYNVGITYRSQAVRDEDKFRVTMIDAGNAGIIGFGGLPKELSLHRANTAAKLPPKNPQFLQNADYDPELKPTQQILERDAQFSTVPSSVVGLSSIPRNVPFAKMLKRQVGLEFQEYEQKLSSDPSGYKRPSLMLEAIEAAYALLLVPDRAIDAVIDKWHLIGDDKPIPFPELTREDFDKVYPPELIKDVVSFRKTTIQNSQENPNAKKLLQEKYSFSIVNKLERIISNNKLDSNESLSLENISDGLFEITKREQNDLNQQYSAEGMKEVMKSRRNDLVKKFSKEQFDHWEDTHPERAGALIRDAANRMKEYVFSPVDVMDIKRNNLREAAERKSEVEQRCGAEPLKSLGALQRSRL